MPMYSSPANVPAKSECPPAHQRLLQETRSTLRLVVSVLYVLLAVPVPRFRSDAEPARLLFVLQLSKLLSTDH